MDLYFQGTAWFNKGPTPEHLMKARGFYERALALDPDNAWALVGMALVDASVAGGHFYDDRAARLTAAEAAVTKALSLAPEFAMGHLCLGLVRTLTNRSDQAIAASKRALTLNRNLATAQAFIGIEG
jgi:tetratricopeptide (TPR) repeat protein